MIMMSVTVLPSSFVWWDGSRELEDKNTLQRVLLTDSPITIPNFSHVLAGREISEAAPAGNFQYRVLQSEPRLTILHTQSQIWLRMTQLHTALLCSRLMKQSFPTLRSLRRPR